MRIAFLAVVLVAACGGDDSAMLMPFVCGDCETAPRSGVQSCGVDAEDAARRFCEEQGGCGCSCRAVDPDLPSEQGMTVGEFCEPWPEDGGA